MCARDYFVCIWKFNIVIGYASKKSGVRFCAVALRVSRVVITFD